MRISDWSSDVCSSDLPPLWGRWPAGQRGCRRYLQGIVICGGTPMARMTMIEAIRSAIDVSMGRDEDVVVFGEDVGYFGGVFRCTQGLQQKYGKTRCFDTPISESGIVGAARSEEHTSELQSL